MVRSMAVSLLDLCPLLNNECSDSLWHKRAIAGFK